MTSASTDILAGAHERQGRADEAASRLLNLSYLVILTLCFLVLRLWLASSLGLSEDEAYYRLWSLAPSLSFLDHPPMVAWLISAGRMIAGDNELGVRLLSPLLLAAGGLVQWRTAALLTDRATAQIATWFYLAIPLLNVGGVIITPDLPSVFFYGLVIWSLAELHHSQNANWWLATGVFAGCGLLSKYTNIFAAASILLWLSAAKENRKWFASIQLWIGGLVALVLFAPVVAWNAAHGWASFAKQFGRVGDGHTLGLHYLAEFLAGQLALLSPVIAILSVLGLWRCAKAAAGMHNAKALLIVASIVPLLSYFALHALHGRVQGNWPAPIYPMLALCAAMAVQASRSRAERLYSIAGCTGFLLSTIIYIHAITPLISLRKDPTAQMHGWQSFTKSISALAEANAAAWIATSSYATTGQLAFYLRTQLPVAQLNEPMRHEHLPLLPKETASKPALYVELERRYSEALLARCFEQFDRIATITRSGETERGISYAVYRLQGLKAECVLEAAGLHAALPAKPSN